MTHFLAKQAKLEVLGRRMSLWHTTLKGPVLGPTNEDGMVTDLSRHSPRLRLIRTIQD